MNSVVHIIPAHVFRNTYHGSYKDVTGRSRWFEARGIAVRRVLVERDDPGVLDGALMPSAPTHVLVEYTHHPRILRYVRDIWPRARLAVRAHNIEPLQHIDNHGLWPRRGPLWLLYGMSRLFVQDIQAKRIADVILSINAWENRIYWNRLPGRATVAWLPYVRPEEAGPAVGNPSSDRRLIACLPTSQKNRKSMDLVLKFIEFADAMQQRGRRDECVVTGDVGRWGLPDSPAVTRLGFVPDVNSLLGSCRAVALLSPLGYGFKTTMGDALAAGAHVLAHPDIIRRTPEPVRDVLIPVDVDDAASLDEAARALARPSAGPRIHAHLVRTNHALMQDVFGEVSP